LFSNEFHQFLTTFHRYTVRFPESDKENLSLPLAVGKIDLLTAFYFPDNEEDSAFCICFDFDLLAIMQEKSLLPA